MKFIAMLESPDNLAHLADFTNLRTSVSILDID